MTKIYFIRHGETVANRDRIIQGTMEFDLSAEGENQLELLKARFENIHIDKIYTSPLLRTVKTALAVRGDRDIEIINESAFIEYDFGLCQGLTHEQAQERFPDVYSTFKNCFYKCQTPEGESYDELYQRAWSATRKVLEQNRGKTVAVVSHGGTVRAIMLKLIFNDITRLNEVPRVTNTAVFEVDFHDDGSYDIKTANDSSHLDKKAADRLEI